MSKKEKKETITKTKSPFKDKALLEKEIADFANKFKVTVVNQSKRISDYFEMSCFNYIVRFYQLHGYDVKVQNLQSKQYRYKCSTSGIQSNFSHFLATIKFEKKEYNFEIQHNLAVQSSHDKELFTTPDISIIKAGKVKTSTTYYDSNKRFSFANNIDVMSFCEVKQFNPFPELLFNFMGVVNELEKDIMINNAINHKPKHIAPSLMISGKPNKQTTRIKLSLEKRYCINIIYDLFYTGTYTFSKTNLSNLRTKGKLQ
ncbi:hypothetical protein IP98_00331 [Flavobacterium cauense R2A-7]|uniref:Uncharacterized protein n=1 Tax=Flavobacterium cauense R2A-7 TaxID=1341154 RepID=A0A562M5Y1_9FLAO|nr:hypothetical protein [Flavobacterium cauense]KGO82370.1 hypothetical protein Q762_06760 [Flavobacterium cauense R2A-7]TWI15339.1 hypothetical protein IP98_00331 [Flavobacterium cauense R2A-7]